MEKTLNYGDWVECYFNLHSRMFSVRKKGKVVAHVTELALTDVKFVSQDAGRNRVREQGRKNVHAFVRGHFAAPGKVQMSTAPKRVSYNPYKDDSFVRVTDAGRRIPIHEAASARLTTELVNEGTRVPKIFVP